MKRRTFVGNGSRARGNAALKRVAVQSRQKSFPLMGGYDKDACDNADAAVQRGQPEAETQGLRLPGHAGVRRDSSGRSAPASRDNQALVARLNRLEQRGRRLVLGLLLLVLLGGYTAWMQIMPGHTAVKRTLVESTELKLVDGSGATRMLLRVASESPVLQLIDREGNTRLALGMRLDETPFIDLSDGNGNTRATLEMNDHGEPSFKLYDNNGKPGFTIN
jgi:hypothetical protein